ncbi:RDD family protein [Hydrotalea sandarakina]|jgi:uncharacterized RDD family membrane protein YckC|uniref:Putative RDD family membrane protein YckC n=1 Tax=Hydrotalea sandarakina TaxID=1004304 RepID=A0A2W7TAA0_9BACT|nr:RDD family protein [Hydrotalea sandarakina]PZX60092.1 putative RDD family membrane protein YckC [Hydrotalea sandarakina]
MEYKKRCEILEDGKWVLASFGMRALSIILDFLFLGIIIYLFQKIIQLSGIQLKHIKIEGFTHIDIEGYGMNPTEKFIIKAILVCLPTIYFTLITYFTNGQTLGKKITGIKVIALYHKHLGLWHCLERSLGYVASSLELGLGFFQSLWNTNRMTLHDKIAETIVVRKYKRVKLQH